MNTVTDVDANGNGAGNADSPANGDVTPDGIGREVAHGYRAAGRCRCAWKRCGSGAGGGRW